ncbi:MAG: ISC system 2Fe-2S type ferredoxin [Azoarcus sp.]|jgi:2Fe-2S ferredoxin|nr:ISC system 2Fe-2S type ferredoxin [Azoarcus sp.]MDR1227956.1 ISC system 2Fe-2S type ferredoxin [Azoarcus sp.]
MTRIVVLPHASLCPQGAVIEAEAGMSLCDALLAGNVWIEHACEQSCACTTCHVVVREGFESLPEASEAEDDLLDRAWGLTPRSRLSCQVAVGDVPLVVEIPRYTINLAREEKHE